MKIDEGVLSLERSAEIDPGIAEHGPERRIDNVFDRSYCKPLGDQFGLKLAEIGRSDVGHQLVFEPGENVSLEGLFCSHWPEIAAQVAGSWCQSIRHRTSAPCG